MNWSKLRNTFFTTDEHGSANRGGNIQPGDNQLLYVVIGDPALQPLEKMTPVKP